MASSRRQIRTFLNPLEGPECPWRPDPSKDVLTWRMEADKHYNDCWNRMLLLLVSPEKIKDKPALILDLLLKAGLIERMTSKQLAGELSITSTGFQFLLLDSFRQAWILLKQYIARDDGKRKRLIEFVFQPGQVLQVLEKEELFVDDMHQLGLLHRKEAHYCLSSLALSLTIDPLVSGSPSAGTPSSISTNGFIILETNYKLYAYTTSPLQLDILALFVHVRGMLPNMLYGIVTRDSIKSALNRGIKAKQIIDYLTVNAHPRMLQSENGGNIDRTTILPHTIIDQMYIWESEMDRLHAATSYLYTDFATQGDFEDAVKFAGTDVLYANSETRRLVIRQEGNERVKEYVKGFRTR